MSENKFSWVGSFTYLFISFSGFSVFLLPFFSLKFELFWVMLLLPVFATLSWFASRLIVGLTYLTQQEILDAELLPRVEYNREIDLPTLVHTGLSHWRGADVVKVGVLYCCLLAVVVLSLVGTDSMGRVFSSSEMQILVPVVMILITVQSYLPSLCLEVIFVLTALTRIAYCVLRLYSEPETRESPSELLVIPGLATAFFYQIPLPTLLAATKGSYAERQRLQLVAVVFCLATYIALTIGLQWMSSPSDSLSLTFKALYLPTKFVSPYIYWCALSRIIITWRYGNDFDSVRLTNPHSMQFLEHFLHWVFYLPFMFWQIYYGGKIEVIYLNAWMPLVVLFVYWSLAIAYEKKVEALSMFPEVKLDLEYPCLVTLLKWTFGTLTLACLGNLAWDFWMNFDYANIDSITQPLTLATAIVAGLVLVGTMAFWKLVSIRN